MKSNHMIKGKQILKLGKQVKNMKELSICSFMSRKNIVICTK